MSQANSAFDFERAVRSLDVRLFGYVPSETSSPDRLSLLAVYNAVYDAFGPFAYLEIGSHVGGTLQVLLMDPRCTSITSVDSRVEMVPDAEREPIPYPENSTERMLKYLALVPGADLAKLETIDASTDELDPAAIAHRPRLCFIDGEHTVEAAVRDARFCRSVIVDEGVIVFHDRKLVRPAIDAFVAELKGTPHQAYPLPSDLFVVSCGRTRLREPVHDMLAPHVERIAARVRRRDELGAS